MGSAVRLDHGHSPATPAPAEAHQPWWKGERGMGPSWGSPIPADVMPIDLGKKIREATEAAEITWLFEPHDAQKLMLESQARFLVAACGRRFGKTLVALRWAAREAIAHQGMVWWVAPTYATAMRAFAECIKLLPRKFRKVNKSLRRIELVGGGCIEFHSADNPDALRGEGLVAVVIDEAAYVDDYVYHDVIRPMLATTNGRVFAISSPRAKKGWFYQLHRQGGQEGANTESWQFPTWTNPYVPADEIEALRLEMPSDAFAREIEAQFLDELAAVFEGVQEVSTLKRPDIVRPGRYLIGIDWGRKQDRSQFSVLRDNGDGTAEQVDLVTVTGVRFSEQLDLLRATVAKWQPEAILAEENSMGGPLVEQLQDEGLPITGFNTNPSTKAPLIQQLRLAITGRAVTLLDDPMQVNELQDYEQDFSTTGRPTFSAPARQHDDTVIALALAWRLIAGEPGGARQGSFDAPFQLYLVDSDRGPTLPEVRADGRITFDDELRLAA